MSNEATFFLLDDSEGDVTVLPYTDGNSPASDDPTEPFTPPTEETNLAVSVMTVQDVQQMQSDLIHVSLFGSFLICGTLIGCTLFRRVVK